MRDRGAENIRIVKDFYKALSNGSPARALSVLAPQVEWTEPGEQVLPFGGRHSGADAVISEVIEVVHDNIIDFEVKPKKFFAVGDLVIVLGHSTGRGRLTDIKLDAPTAHIWTMADGRAVRFQAYHDLLEWQVVLGLTSVQSQRLAA
jgi:ketosteroid isomerase-like protein